MKKIKIALLEDNLTDIKNLVDYFERSNLVEVKHTFLSGVDFLNLPNIKTLDIDAVVIDYRMPNIDGLVTIRNLMYVKPPYKLLMVSHGYYRSVMNEMTAMGSQNYIQKNGELIIKSLQRLIAGQEIYDDPTAIFNWDLLTQRNDLKLQDRKLIETIKPRDKKIIRLAGLGLCSNEIGAILNYETSSIEKYRGNILKEHDLKNSLQLSSWAFSNEIVTSAFLFQANQKNLDESTLQPDEFALLKSFKAHRSERKAI